MTIYINGSWFTLVNPTTKKAEELRSRYNFFVSIKGTRNIYQAYRTKPSWAKIQAYEKWLRFCQDIDGHNMTVLGANTYMFSCAFKHARGLFIINPSSRYFVADCVSTYQALKGGNSFEK